MQASSIQSKIEPTHLKTFSFVVICMMMQKGSAWFLLCLFLLGNRLIWRNEKRPNAKITNDIWPDVNSPRVSSLDE